MKEKEVTRVSRGFRNVGLALVLSVALASLFLGCQTQGKASASTPAPLSNRTGMVGMPQESAGESAWVGFDSNEAQGDPAVREEAYVPFETAKYGVMTGTLAEVYLAEAHPQATISTFPTIVDALASLSNGKIDYVMTSYTTALNGIRLQPSLKIVKGKEIPEACAIAVTKENPALLTQLNEVLARLEEDGTLEEITSYWTRINREGGRADPPVASGKNGVLRVAISADREPMCFVEDGKYTGLDCELIRRMAYEMDMTVEFQNMQFGSLLAALASNKADVIISNITSTEEREESVNFTTGYFNNPQVLVAKKREGEYTALSQLSGKTLSSVTGTVLDQIIHKILPSVQFSYVNTPEEGIASLRSGKVEGIPTDEPIGQRYINAYPDLAILPEWVVEDQYGMVLVKDSPYTAPFNQEIQAMKEDGRLEALREKWLGAQGEKKQMPDLDYPAPNGTLRVACSASMEPMCYVGEGGSVVGFEAELAALLAKSVGKKLEMIPVEFSGLAAMLESGKADMLVGCYPITDERKETTDMTDSYYDGGVVIVVRKAASQSVTPLRAFESLKVSFVRTFVTEDRWKLVLNGLVVTVVLSVCSGLLGSMLGFGICMLRRSKRRALSVPMAVLIRVVQGTPIVVLLMILYYIAFGQVDISAMFVAILGFGVNFGVYVSEMIRTGIDAVDGGQIEAAYALGFSRMRTFWKITFPQAARHFLPVFRGEFISMVKMTSVVGYIAIQDLTKVSDIIRSRTMEAFFPLIATAVLYFIVATVLTAVLSHVEMRLDPKRRKRAVKGVVRK